MTDIAKKALKLGLIGAIAALLLAALSNLAEPLITLRREAEMKAVLNVLADGEETGTPESVSKHDILRRWRIADDGGWILEMEASGYGGPMLLVASYRDDGAIMAARLLDNKETVGFGKKAENPAYMDVFSGFGSKIPVPRNEAELGDGADLISGATITFNGIVAALEKG